MFLDLRKVFDAVRNGFENRRVLVIGDLMIDRYLWGNVQRISPEAPVPVVRIDNTTHSPGGAANVAANLKVLGCHVRVAGMLGADQEARHLLGMLEDAGIETQAIVSVPGGTTTTKTRILGGQQQMLRLDTEQGGSFAPEVYDLLSSRIEAQFDAVSAIILSDYGKGVLSDSICRATIHRARERSIPVFVDPKGLNYEKYTGCVAICPNRMELAAVTASDCADSAVLFEKGERLRSELRIDHLLVTMGELGITLLDSRGVRRFPAQAREVYDVSGAGDTVIAMLSAAIAAGLSLDDSVRLANIAAGLVVSKIGTTAVDKNELIAALSPLDNDTRREQKIWSPRALFELVARWRLAGRRIVFTNGCFDLLHVGHLTLLEQARQMGDYLIVALNSDRSVRAVKGPGRPILSENARANLLAALPCVDAVVLFDEDTPVGLIRELRPDVLAKGGDYLEEEVVGANEMKTWGGKVVLVPLVKEFKTQAILKKATADLHDGSVEFVQLQPESAASH